jgi:hypothetical protein
VSFTRVGQRRPHRGTRSTASATVAGSAVFDDRVPTEDAEVTRPLRTHRCRPWPLPSDCLTPAKAPTKNSRIEGDFHGFHKTVVAIRPALPCTRFLARLRLRPPSM